MFLSRLVSAYLQRQYCIACTDLDDSPSHSSSKATKSTPQVNHQTPVNNNEDAVSGALFVPNNVTNVIR